MHRPPSAKAPSARPRRTRRRSLIGLGRLIAVPLLLAAVVTAGSPGWGSYLIRPGDNLESIARRYHTTVAQLVQVNHLPGNGNLIYAGARLRVPVPHANAARTVTVRRLHRVVRGDSLIKIANKYGVNPATIASANRLPRSLMVRLGDVLVVPVTQRVSASHAQTSGNTFAGRTYPSSIVSAAARNRAALATRRLPSRTAMRALMRRVSVANAIGAMQVIPATGAWASSVVGRRLNLLSPTDNVTAGVVLLRVLTKSASDRNAIAGYYQGLASVRRHGMYADTKRYVANVLYLQKRFARG
jgi:LysM repeat protein